MRPTKVFILGLLVAILAVAFATRRISGQSTEARTMITQRVDDSKVVVLKGNTYPLARAEFDRGTAPAGLPMEHMLMVLRRSPSQQTSVDQLLAEQADKSSANFHKWLTPAEFGSRFGASDDDVRTITSWLESRGFQGITIPAGRNVVEFSGNVSQVQSAFHTEIHSYVVNGRQHYANASDPSIPEALAPAVAGLVSLHNFGRRPMSHFAGMYRKAANSSKAEPIHPQYTFPGGCFANNNCYAVGPNDFAKIYGVDKLWSAGITGNGITIGVVSDSNITLSDVTKFRSLFGLPTNNPTVVLVSNHNPGITADEVEATIDTEWSGAVAENAKIDLVVGTSTNTTFGGDLAAEDIVNNTSNENASVLSESYGECELGLGNAGNVYYQQLWSQAATEGITVSVSTGDSGSAGCETPVESDQNEQPATTGLAVNGLASTQYNVAVGGTDFNQITNATSFWNSANTSGTQSSVKGYIPETTWNDSCTNAVLGTDFANDGFSTNAETNCNNLSQAELIQPVGGSGGTSNCTTSNGETVSSCSGGYAKPSWQVAPGVPSNNKRYTPDISLFAGDGFAGSFYVVCQADQNTGGVPCSLTADGYSDFAGYGGTSVSAQVFAGIVALLDQKDGGKQGNVNTILYPLAAAESASSCNSSSPASTCVFNDVTVGTIAGPCVKGSPNCTVNTSSDANGILSGFSTGTGYDEATGLGSLNAYNLVNPTSGGGGGTPGLALSTTNSTVSVSAPGSTGTFSATVSATNGFTGAVTFACTGMPSESSCSFNPASATLSATTTSATTTVTVATTAPSSAFPASRKPDQFLPMTGVTRVAAVSIALAMCLMGMLAVLFAPRGKRVRHATTFALAMFATAGIVAMSACGGGSSGGGGGGTTGGTPVGTTSPTVSATSGATSTSLGFTLTVE